MLAFEAEYHFNCAKSHSDSADFHGVDYPTRKNSQEDRRFNRITRYSVDLQPLAEPWLAAAYTSSRPQCPPANH